MWENFVSLLYLTLVTSCIIDPFLCCHLLYWIIYLQNPNKNANEISGKYVLARSCSEQFPLSKTRKGKNIPDFHTDSNNRSRGPCMDSHTQDTSHLDTFGWDTFDRDTSGLETDCFD